KSSQGTRVSGFSREKGYPVGTPNEHSWLPTYWLSEWFFENPREILSPPSQIPSLNLVFAWSFSVKHRTINSFPQTPTTAFACSFRRFWISGLQLPHPIPAPVC